MRAIQLPALKITNAKTLSEFLEIIEGLQISAASDVWFRGAGVTTHTLVPTLYRHPKAASTDFQKLERDIMNRFRQRGLPYHSRDLRDAWEALFFMQHYGVPTRLLDWSENPFTALYFALMSAPVEVDATGKRTHSKPAAVWVLNPQTWNAKALEHLSYKGGPLALGDEGLNGFSPNPTAPVTNVHPVALFGSHNSARIVAQQGVFTIFGTHRTPMERLVREGTFPVTALTRITIAASRIEAMRDSLLSKGITETVIFPDLEGLAHETLLRL